MDIIKNFIFPNKNDTLDPLSIIIKLFIYSYKPVGTKISIYNNRLYIQDAWILQGTIRSLNRDTKNDVNIITFPIIYACEKYLLSDKRKEYIPIFERVLLSFDKLKGTYLGDEITYSIEQLKTILDSYVLSDKFDITTLIQTYNSPASTIKKTRYENINTIWTTNRLNTLFGLINEIFDHPTDIELQTASLYSLHTYMVYIDIISYSILKDL